MGWLAIWYQLNMAFTSNGVGHDISLTHTLWSLPAMGWWLSNGINQIWLSPAMELVMISHSLTSLIMVSNGCWPLILLNSLIISLLMLNFLIGAHIA
jgi:hypothetical protein